MSTYENKYGPIVDRNKMGTIQRWPANGNYGFIKQDDGNEDLFVHWEDVISNEELNRGMRVKYDVCQESKREKFRAVGVCEVENNGDKEKTIMDPLEPVVHATASGAGATTTGTEVTEATAAGAGTSGTDAEVVDATEASAAPTADMTAGAEVVSDTAGSTTAGTGVTTAGEKMQFKPPDGIEVDVIPVKQRGEALQGPETADGKRSVYFRDGTEYKIEIRNKLKVNNKYVRVAALVSVDGRKATPTPFIIRQKSSRIVSGFTVSRKSVEAAEPSNNGRINTETLIETFIARRQDNSADSGDLVDTDIGEIRIEFFPVRFVKGTPGRHFNQLPRIKTETPRRGRANVLVTKSAKYHTHVGYHGSTNPGRPIADRRKGPFAVSGWTIYDRYPKQSPGHNE